MTSIRTQMTSYWTAWHQRFTIKAPQAKNYWKMILGTNPDSWGNPHQGIQLVHGLFSLSWPSTRSWQSQGHQRASAKLAPNEPVKLKTSSKAQYFGWNFAISWVIRWLYEAMKIINCTILWTVYECHDIHFSLWNSVWHSCLHTPP